MAAITTTAASVGIIFPEMAERYTGVAAAAITAGQAVLQNANGKVALAAATGDVWGIAITSAGIGQAVTVLVKGHMEGADVSAMAPHDAIYTGAAGALDTTGTVQVGKVLALSDSSATKVAYIG